VNRILPENRKPIYLFADSQLLFWRPRGKPFLLTLRNLIESKSFKAAYVGASNGDNPVYYSIFESAVKGIGVTDYRMIPASPSEADVSFVEQADLILLSGGDVEKGWTAFERSGLKQIIISKYHKGVILIGISAGAVQLGMFGCAESDKRCEVLFPTFGLVPFVISAHDEKDNWSGLKKMLNRVEWKMNGIGIPAGGGMVYHPDNSIEPIRYSLYNFSIGDGRISQNMISFP
jgi:peptidase E